LEAQVRKSRKALQVCGFLPLWKWDANPGRMINATQ